MLRVRAVALVLASVVLTPGLVTAAGKPAVKRTEVGKNVFLEVEGGQRRVIVGARVCLREGPLEGLLTRQGKKEHEYLLAADLDARHIHAALLVAGAKPGAPVQFLPKYVPASGSTVKVSLRFQEGGKTVTVPAADRVREAKTKKALATAWVFGGSRFIPDPEGANRPPFYVANHGDVICLCNMDSAMMDLPVQSPKKFDSRIFEANTARVPPRDTAVELILEVVPPTGPK